MLQSNKLISNYREPALFDRGKLVVAKERNTQINRRRWGGAGRGVEWRGLQAPQHREGYKGWTEDARESGGAGTEQTEVGSWSRALLAPGEAPAAVSPRPPADVRVAGSPLQRGPSAAPTRGEPGLETTQACKDRGVVQPPTPLETPPTRAQAPWPQPSQKWAHLSSAPGSRGVAKVSHGARAAAARLGRGRGEAGTTPAQCSSSLARPGEPEQEEEKEEEGATL